MYTRSIDRSIVKKGRDHKLIVRSVAGSDPTDSKGVSEVNREEKPVVSNESKQIIVECDLGNRERR